jgi:hypothetical protein
MTRDWNSGPISDFHLELFVLGELPQAQASRLQERLTTDAALRERLKAVREHERTFPLAFPADEVVPRIKAASLAAPAPVSPARFAAAAPPATAPESRPIARPGASPLGRLARAFRVSPAFQIAGAFAVLLLAAIPLVLHRPSVATADSRLKGIRPELRLYRDTPSGPERLASGSRAAPGDVIQIEFHPGDYPYGAIISVDGGGGVTLHWPKDARAGTALSVFRGYRLPEAFKLDAAPRFERFYLLLSRDPIDVEAMLRMAALSAGRDEGWLAAQAPASIRVTDFTLVK